MPSKRNRYVQRHKHNERSAAATKHIGFGAIVFFIIFVYILITLISYALKENVNYTVAETGTLSYSDDYTGMVIKDETVITADTSGSLKYFFPEGARVRNNNPVFGIVTDQEMMKILDEEIFRASQALSADDSIFDESYDYLKGRIRNYVINQYSSDFSYTYDARQQIENDIAEIRNTVVIQQQGSSQISVLENQYEDAVSLVRATKSGLISYKIDGLEDINIDTFQFGDLARKTTVQDTSAKTVTDEGQPVFKIIDNYLWYVVAEIDDACEKQLEIYGQSYKNIEFIDKDITIPLKIIDVVDEGEKTFLILESDRKISQFLSDRYVRFRINYETHEGIKIPETAVTTKTFAVIPSDFKTIINKQYAVLKKVYSEDAPGNETIDPSFIKSFKPMADMVCVPLSDELSVGDTLSYTDEDTRVTTEFIIDETIDLEGVYVINKGFAVFKFIDTMYKENDYRIVASDMDYGVRIYDRIVSEASETEEYQVIN